ncbi:MAG: aspartate--tRNA ligase [Candidatus Parvarchaeota archaeon]|nr:aspartate--tRNA ligase [Candidatus Parvarchaeota archaeon]
MEITCGELTDDKYEGKEVSINGWCRYIRIHKDKAFIDLADRYGITQIIFQGRLLDEASQLGREFVIRVEGKVRRRDKKDINPDMPTGKFEILASKLKVINKSKVPPFEVIDEKIAFLPDEDLRFKYRYLDLRRRNALWKIEFRDKVVKSIRKFFWDNDFLELETPLLIKDTYDASGSRTFIVPSRIHKGEFYGLPQSPQIYKQLSMISGLDKYFQIAKVFRDEDPREDRQPEFTQLDVETSFKDETYVQTLIEKMVERVFSEVLHKKIKTPFQHIDYKDAIRLYGNDKPDLRFDNKIVDLTEELAKSDYNIIKNSIKSGGKAIGIKFEAQFGTDRSKLDKNFMTEMVEKAKTFGLGGLTWLFIKDRKLRSEPEKIAEALSSQNENIIKKVNGAEGDIIIIGTDSSESLLLSAMSKLRRIIGIKIGKFKEDYSFLWVDRFPVFEEDEITKKLVPMHNPFVMPTDDSLKLIDSKPAEMIGRRYDLVLNGVEVGGGSIRIHDHELQRKILKIMGLDDKEIDESLGFLIEALSYGAPIHGGIALGLDRFVATLAGEDDIREFILFPKNRKFESFIDGSPKPVSEKRLKEDFNLRIDRT